MFKNYLTVALRHLRQHKIYALINVSGLAIGIAFCILTFLFIHNEWTYDTFHVNADRIFRVYRVDVERDGSLGRPVDVRIPMGPTLKDMFPDIEAFVRFTGGRDAYFKLDGKTLAGGHYNVDPEFFDVFDFPLKLGDSKTALNDLNSLVLSARMAQRFFGDENPIGRILTQATKTPEGFVVTGVFEPLPSNSSIQFDFLSSHKRELKSYPNGYVWNRYSSTKTFIVLHHAVKASELKTKFPLTVERIKGESAQTGASLDDFSLHLQPLTDMHLNTEIILGPVSNPKYSYILSGIALLVLMIACINFMNLSMGQSATRAKEIGIRKVVGAARRQLMNQFWGESVLLSVFALVFGVALAELFLPTFNGLLNQKLDILYFANATTLIFLIGLVLVVGLAAGSVPALVLSRFQPVEVMKGHLRVGGMGWAGQGLIIVQFALSIFLVVSAFVMSGQLDYIRDKNLGFHPEQIVSVDLWFLESEGKQKSFEKAVLQHPDVLASAYGNPWWYIGFTDRPLGTFTDGRVLSGREFHIGYDFFETLKMELVAGRNFSPDHGSDERSGMVVNETLVREMGWNEPIGKRLPFQYQRNPEVVGVVKDFHLNALHHRIQPWLTDKT